MDLNRIKTIFVGAPQAEVGALIRVLEANRSWFTALLLLCWAIVLGGNLLAHESLVVTKTEWLALNGAVHSAVLLLLTAWSLSGRSLLGIGMRHISDPRLRKLHRNDDAFLQSTFNPVSIRWHLASLSFSAALCLLLLNLVGGDNGS